MLCNTRKHGTWGKQQYMTWQAQTLVSDATSLRSLPALIVPAATSSWIVLCFAHVNRDRRLLDSCIVTSRVVRPSCGRPCAASC